MMSSKKDKIIKKAFSILLTVIMALTVCFCLFAAIQSMTRGYVSVGKKSFFRVITGSMEPTLDIGELIMTNNVNIEDAELDDIICFRSKEAGMMGAIITHRVVGIKSAEDGTIQIVSKGDANLTVDPYYVTSDNFIGKMVWSSGDSAVSNVLAFLTSSSGFFVCIVLPTILILLLILHENARSMKRDMDELLEKIKEAEQVNEAASKPLIDKEEYNEMRERIRKELMEELKGHDESEQS